MRRRVTLGAFVAAGLVVAVALAFLVAPEASSEPDGLERVAIDEGFAETASDHALDDSPTADYGVEGVDDERLGTGLAGLLGIAVTFVVAGGVFWVVRRFGGGGRSSSDGSPEATPVSGPPSAPASASVGPSSTAPTQAPPPGTGDATG